MQTSDPRKRIHVARQDLQWQFGENQSHYKTKQMLGRKPDENVHIFTKFRTDAIKEPVEDRLYSATKGLKPS